MKLGVPDDREPEYTRYFIQAPVSELTNAHPVPEQLTVPASPTTDLTILVDFASTVSASLGSFITHQAHASGRKVHNSGEFIIV